MKTSESAETKIYAAEQYITLGMSDVAFEVLDKLASEKEIDQFNVLAY